MTAIGAIRPDSGDSTGRGSGLSFSGAKFAAKVDPNTSARIMIPCTDSTNGKPIFEC